MTTQKAPTRLPTPCSAHEGDNDAPHHNPMVTRLRPRKAHALDLQGAGTAGVCRDVFPDGWKADAQGVGCRRVRVLCCEDVAVNDWRYLEEEARYWWEVEQANGEANAIYQGNTQASQASAGTYGAERKRENVLRASHGVRHRRQDRGSRHRAILPPIVTGKQIGRAHV